MHENRNLFLFLIEIDNMHCTRHILPIPCKPGPVFGAGADGVVFRDGVFPIRRNPIRQNPFR